MVILCKIRRPGLYKYPLWHVQYDNKMNITLFCVQTLMLVWFLIQQVPLWQHFFACVSLREKWELRYNDVKPPHRDNNMGWHTEKHNHVWFLNKMDGSWVHHQIRDHDGQHQVSCPLLTMTTLALGTPVVWPSASILRTTSIPSTTLPNTTCFPSSFFGNLQFARTKLTK